MGGGLKDRLRRLLQSNDEMAAEELQRQAVQAGAQQVTQCHDREKVTLRGQIESITINPAGQCGTLTAMFSDGSGEVELHWMGRKEIRGIKAGTSLEVEGRISCQEGRRRMFNPSYELLEVPEA